MLKLKPFIKSRLKAIGKHHNKSFKGGIPSAKKYIERETHKGIDVYDKIGLYGLGKIIYIRSK